MVPMHDLDGLWREYEKFENDWSTTTAETVTAKPREQYAAAKKAHRERKQLWEGVKMALPARPPAYDEDTGELVPTLHTTIATRNVENQFGWNPHRFLSF